MLDQKLSALQQPIWNALAKLAHRLGLTPNHVTWLGLLLATATALLYLWHGRAFLFGVSILIIEAGDNVDGALARLTGTSSRYGAFLDAATDRYKEGIVLGVIGWSHPELWPLCFLAVIGALLTSYHKARATAEVAVSNTAWPDLFERLERVLVVSATLILEGLLAPDRVPSLAIAKIGLMVLAIGSHFTAAQRFLRARRILTNADGG